MHQAVCRNERRDNVKDLVLRPPHGVPCSPGEEASKGSLTIRAHGVDNGAFAGLAAAFVGVAPAADVPSTRCLLAMSYLIQHACILRHCVDASDGVDVEGSPRWMRSGDRRRYGRAGDVRGFVACAVGFRTAGHCDGEGNWAQLSGWGAVGVDCGASVVTMSTGGEASEKAWRDLRSRAKLCVKLD